MREVILFPIGITDSCRFASQCLSESGFTITDHLTPEITHLLLDIPSFNEFGNLRDGSDLEELLRRLPGDITIIGGHLKQPYLEPYHRIDLLENAFYLAQNAAITAECALQVAAHYLHSTFSDSSALILGWGRIGKCLANLLKALGCHVTVAARKESDRAMLNALNFSAVSYEEIPGVLRHCTLMFNTVPQQTVDSGILNQAKNCIKIDLSSAPGIICDDLIIARGLPGKYAPKTSGRLIAEAIQTALKEDTL